MCRVDDHLLIVHVEHCHRRVEAHGELDEEMHGGLALRPHDGAADGRLVHLGLPHQAEHRARLVAQHGHHVPRLGADRVVAVAQQVERAPRRLPPVPLRRVRHARFERRRLHLVLAALDALQQRHRLRLAAALVDPVGHCAAQLAARAVEAKARALRVEHTGRGRAGMLPARGTVGTDRLGLSSQCLQLRGRLRKSGAQASIRASLIALSVELHGTCAAFGDSEAAVVGRSRSDAEEQGRQQHGHARVAGVSLPADARRALKRRGAVIILPYGFAFAPTTTVQISVRLAWVSARRYPPPSTRAR